MLLEEFKEREGDDPNDVIFNNSFGLRSIELNRPGKLNALDASMVRKIVPRLLHWDESDMANVLVIKGAGDRALCAGGDVATLAEQNKSRGTQGQIESTAYFSNEYRLDHLIATYSKPVISFMDGITMGGGVGLSAHAPFRIATERTVFAMPETTIGFFPDVGASFFLPRLNGHLGTYLGLTSDRVSGADAFYTGIATHYLHSTSLPALEARLAELRFLDHQRYGERMKIVHATIEEFATGLPHDEPPTFAGELREAIDRCFGHDSIHDILESLRLEAESGPAQEWARKTLATLHERSPTSVLVTLRQLRTSGEFSLAEAFNHEYRLASRFMQHPDFVEGVTARLISKEKPKPKPKWNPASLEDIPADKESQSKITDPFFADEGENKLRFFSKKDHTEYPHSRFGVPTEAQIRKLCDGQHTPQQVHRTIMAQNQGRQGISQIVAEILKRKTTTSEDGKTLWVD